MSETKESSADVTLDVNEGPFSFPTEEADPETLSPQFTFVNPTCNPHASSETSQACEGHDGGHVHSDSCGHERVEHDDHYDYVVGTYLHHPHDEHCDHHGEVLNAVVPLLPSPRIARSLVPCRIRMLEDLKDHPSLPWYKDKSAIRFITMTFLTGSLFFVELIVGLAINSLALQADAFHMASDLLALFIGFFAARISKKAPTVDVTYGWKRYEVIGAIINGVFLLAVCFTIALESFQRFGSLDEIADSLGDHVDELLWVAVSGLAVNLVGLVVFGHGDHGHSHGGHGHSHGAGAGNADEHEDEHDGHGHSHGASGHGHSHGASGHGHSHGDGETQGAAVADAGHAHDGAHGHAHGLSRLLCCRRRKGGEGGHGHAHDGHGHAHGLSRVLCCRKGRKKSKRNMNEEGVFLHVLGDALGSVGVIVSALVIKYGGESHLRFLVDPFASLFIVCIITYSSYPLVKRCVDILLHRAPSEVSMPDLRTQLLAVKGVVGVHELHVWQLSNDKWIGTLHFSCQLKATAPVPASLSISPWLRNRAQTSALLNVGKVIEELKEVFHKHNIHNTTIQPEFVDDCNTNAEHCHEPVCEPGKSASCETAKAHR